MSGVLGRANLTLATDTVLYTVPSGKTSACSVNFCNTSSGEARVRLSLSVGSTPVAGEYVEYDALIPSGGVLERGGVVVGAGDKIIVRSNVAGVNVLAWGYEE